MNSPPMPTDDRAKAWSVLADLFLDTSFDEEDRDRMASELRALPFSVSELDNILRREVAPAFAMNLFSMAGEWTGWTPEGAADMVARTQRPCLVRGLRNGAKAAFGMAMAGREWRRISRKV